MYTNLPAVSGFIEQVVYDLKEFQNTIIFINPLNSTSRYLPGSQRIPVDMPDPSARYYPVQNILTGIQ